MLENFITLSGGLVVLALTFFSLWISVPRPDGPARWFIGTNMEAMISVAITTGLVLGIGMLAAGLMQMAGLR